MAARIVVEECLNVVLDLDDLDRLWVNSASPHKDKADLTKRRSNMLEVGLSSSQFCAGSEST